MNFRPLLAALATAIALPASLSAATIDFAGSNRLWDQGQLSFADAATSRSFTVHAGTYTGSDAPFATQRSCGTCISQHGNGLSVLTKNDTTHELDGNEYLTFVFDQAVDLDAVWLNSADYHDRFDMAVDNVDIDIAARFGSSYINSLLDDHYGLPDGMGLPFDDLKSTYSTDFKADFRTAGGSLRGSVFTFYTEGKSDDYKIGGIAFSAIAPVAAIPLPAGALLVLTGLGAFGALRGLGRRSRKAV